MHASTWVLVSLVLSVTAASFADQKQRVSIERNDVSLQIRIDGRPLATYVWNDAVVRRPYFAHLHAPNGKQVSRTHPPVEGRDATDHATMHPGLWLAFGDLS